LDGATAGLVVLDVDGDLRPELLVWSGRGVKLYQQGRRDPGGLEDLKEVLSIAPGDFDNDGLTDLCADRRGDGTIPECGWKVCEAPSNPACRELPQGVWLDFDHDYDLDLILLREDLGPRRNNGRAGFSDLTHAFPFVQGAAIDGCASISYRRPGMDLAVAYADRPGVLYRDHLSGKYEAVPLEVLPKGVLGMGAFDVDNDGWTDLAVGDGTSRPADERPQKWLPELQSASGCEPVCVCRPGKPNGERGVAGRAVFRNKGLGAFDAAMRPNGLEQRRHDGGRFRR
jgi:hypothetical protein